MYHHLNEILHRNFFFLVQDPIQDHTLHLVVTSATVPWSVFAFLGIDSFEEGKPVILQNTCPWDRKSECASGPPQSTAREASGNGLPRSG